MNRPITIMELNDVHMDQKERMQSKDLDLLKSASFEDNSWGDDECPSFHRDSRYNKDHFYEIYVCYVILDGKTKGNYHVRPEIAAMYNKEETLLNVDGQDYFHEVSEAIIACVKHDEESNKSAKNKEKNLENYHKNLIELDNDQSAIFLTLQTIHAQWCKIHDLEFMCANDMLTVCNLDDHQREWLKAYGKAWDGMEEIKRFHGYAYNNAGEEL